MNKAETDLLDLRAKTQMEVDQAMLRLTALLDSTVNHLLDIRSSLRALTFEPQVDPLYPARERLHAESTIADAVKSLLGVCVALNQTGHVVPLMEAWQDTAEALHMLRTLQAKMHALAVSDITRDPIEQHIDSPDYLDGD